MKVSIYNASAGSGKTFQLAYKYVYDIIKNGGDNPLLYRHILAVTFTNKATEEMKRRILLQVHLLAKGEAGDYLGKLTSDLGIDAKEVQRRAQIVRNNILHDYSRFTILTIDKFFQRILRAFVQELGIDIGYNLEIETTTMIEQSADSLIESITQDAALRDWLVEFVQERTDSGHKWNIRDGILSLSKELFNEQARGQLKMSSAEAAEGKLSLKRLIEERIAEAELAMHHVVEVAQQGYRLILDNGLTVEDFANKSNFIPIFENYAKHKPHFGTDMPTVTKWVLNMKEQTDPVKWSKTNPTAAALSSQLQPILYDMLESHNAAMGKINTANLLRENYRSFALLSDLYLATEQLCKEQNTMLLTQTAQIIEKFISDTDAPFIYEKVGNRFSHFMIDEFQDTSGREWSNFLPLLRNSMSQCGGDANPILIVGDIKQSIYRWRGGDWRLLHEKAAEDLTAEGGTGDAVELFNLDTNYRSAPGVIAFNNFIIDRVMNMENDFMNEQLTTANVCLELRDTIKSAYSSFVQRSTPKSQRGFVEVVTYERDDEPTIDRVCGALDRGYKPCDILILARRNRDAAKIAQQLLEFKSRSCGKYRFDVITQEALIVGNAPVSKFVMAVMRLALKSGDKLQRGIYNRFLGRDVADVLSASEQNFLRKLRMYSPIEAFEKIVLEYDLGSVSDNVAYLQTIHDQVIYFANNMIGDLRIFLNWWDEKGSNISLTVERSDNAIEIMSIHKAKGLERKVVIIPYCDWKRGPMSSGVIKTTIWAKEHRADSDNGALFPVNYKESMANSDFSPAYYTEKLNAHLDSLNTLYVALTRAVESLHIFAKATTTQKHGYQVVDGVGRLIVDALSTMPEELSSTYNMVDTKIGGDVTNGKMAEQRTMIAHQFGELTYADGCADDGGMRATVTVSEYNSSPSKLKLHMPTRRYREESEEGEFTPREIGIAMHKAFESAKSRDDISKNIEAMLAGGHISESEHRELSAKVAESLQNSYAAEWFDTKWDSIRNESSIIAPAAAGSLTDTQSTRRPDRVMIRGNRAVVVDYKFGLLNPKSHETQLRRYMALLRDMGYTQVEGFIWYLRQNKITQI